MQPYKFSYPEQNRIYQKLTILVGPGAAAFYKDACRLMEMDIPFEATTHLVGHLLREVESSLRDVLESLSNPVISNPQANLTKCPNCWHLFQYQKPLPSHKDEIHAIFEALGVNSEEDIAKLWLSLAGKNSKHGLHTRAHREDLAAPRVVDAEFRTFWRQIQKILDAVLDRFESCAAPIREKLDELLIKSKPNKQDINFLRLNTPNSHFAIGYFFDRLESPAWLKPLHEAGFFDNLPGLAIDPEGKFFRFPVWAQSRYLTKVAPHKPEAVLAIAVQLFDTGSDNIRIYEDLAEAALKMAPEFTSRLVERAVVWLGQQPVLTVRFPDTWGKLIAYLARENQVDVAINLTRELLAVLPPSDSSLYIAILNEL